MTLIFPVPQADWRTDPFAPIGLDELNARADMLSRIDNKYVVTDEVMERLMPAFADHFDILDIGGKRAFTYDTRYFDSPDLVAYYQHHQGLRKGFKVRVRHYVDAGLTYLELKVKGTRGMTVKHRMSLPGFHETKLSAEGETFIRETYGGHYGQAFRYPLQAALDIRYARITLVARDGRERMTIDTDLSFGTGPDRVGTGRSRYIIETKSENGRGIADKMLRAEHARPTKRCSKYCLGQAALGRVSRFNRFLPTLRKLNLAETAIAAQHQTALTTMAA